jgi:hypothetical protein
MLTDNLRTIEAAIQSLDDLTHHQPDGQAMQAQKAFSELSVIANNLLVACKAQHAAIDMLFAMLITRDRVYCRVTCTEPFLPSKSGPPWDALVVGNAAIAKAEVREPT